MTDAIFIFIAFVGWVGAIATANWLWLVPLAFIIMACLAGLTMRFAIENVEDEG